MSARKTVFVVSTLSPTRFLVPKPLPPPEFPVFVVPPEERVFALFCAEDGSEPLLGVEIGQVPPELQETFNAMHSRGLLTWRSLSGHYVVTEKGREVAVGLGMVHGHGANSDKEEVPLFPEDPHPAPTAKPKRVRKARKGTEDLQRAEADREWDAWARGLRPVPEETPPTEPVPKNPAPTPEHLQALASRWPRVAPHGLGSSTAVELEAPAAPDDRVAETGATAGVGPMSPGAAAGSLRIAIDLLLMVAAGVDGVDVVDDVRQAVIRLKRARKNLLRKTGGTP